MSPIDSFTVERLEEIINFTHENGIPHASRTEWQALAKIALAAKLAKPSCWEIAGQLFTTKEQALEPGYRGSPYPLYDEPPHPQLPDGWVLVPKELNVDMYNAWVDCRLGLHEEWAAMLAAAPKP